MSDILQAKTITGEYSGFADSALRAESGNFLTAVPEGYATEDWVTAQGYLTGLPSDLVYTADIADMATTGDINDLVTSISETYQPTAGMTAYQSAGDYYSASNPSGFITAVPDTYLQNTDLTISDNKVTEISGIPLSAGGDVPEGVMVESGLEFNAVNEISGYSGSAIAQYGAEKQWLTHDDTIVHVSNSAQYALGCNVPVVAQQMGIDETVLWSGNIAGSGSTLTLNESYTSFDKLAFYARGVYQPSPLISTFKIVDSDSFRLSIPSLDGGSYYNWIVNIIFTGVSGSLVRSFVISEGLTSTTRTVTNGSTGGGTPVSLEKIVGIGKKV